MTYVVDVLVQQWGLLQLGSVVDALAQQLRFLPQFPPLVSQLTWFGVLLAVGVIAGEAACRYLRLPRVTGYVIAGALLGPEASGVLTSDMLLDLRLLADLSIGLVVFELGFRLNLEWLRQNRWLPLAALAESFVCFAAIFGTLLAFGFRPLLAATAAAIGTAASPAVTTFVAADLRSEGQVTERMMLFTAVSTVFAYVSLMLLLPMLHIERGAELGTLLRPVYVFAGSLLLGTVACRLLLALATWLGKRQGRQFVLLVATVVVTIGLARMLGCSVPLALLTLGALARNADGRNVLVPVRFGAGSELFYVILFVLTGAALDFHAMGVAAAAAVAAFIVVRFLGKALAVLAFAPGTGLGWRPGALLAVALVPLSGQAVAMVSDTVSLYPSFGRELAAIVLSAVVVLELLGPIATQLALKRAGEARPDSSP